MTKDHKYSLRLTEICTTLNDWERNSGTSATWWLSHIEGINPKCSHLKAARPCRKWRGWRVRGWPVRGWRVLGDRRTPTCFPLFRVEVGQLKAIPSITANVYELIEQCFFVMRISVTKRFDGSKLCFEIRMNRTNIRGKMTRPEPISKMHPHRDGL